ncbi:MAG: amidohydrolase family protein [Gammaproteobacteria bacterium]
MIVDAHQHFWRLDDPGRTWPPGGLAAIHRDFAPHDLAPLLKEHRIGATVLVQSMECARETVRMLEVAERTPWIAGVVGWTDLKAPDAAALIGQLAGHPKLRGLRPMLQGLKDDNWIDDAALRPAVEAMLAGGLAFDALVTPRHLPALFAFACRYPTLPVVIDHAGKPPIRSGELARWSADMAHLATLPNVVCKLSGLVTEASPEWKVRDLLAPVEHVLDYFGPQRILWGSDWPVLNLACDYAHWFYVSRAMLAHLNQGECAAIFGGNARRVYRLDVPATNFNQKQDNQGTS